MKAVPGQGLADALIAATHTDVIGDGHRCGASVATIGHRASPRPLDCASRDSTDASHPRHFTSTHTYSTDTEEMT